MVPKGWNIKKLGEVTTKIGSGNTPKGGESVYKRSGAPFIRSQNVGWGKLILHDLYYLPDEIQRKMSSTILKKHDVLLNITGASIGRSAIVDKRIEGGNVNQHVCIIRSKPEILSPFFLNQFLISDRGQNLIDSFQSGGNRQGLNFEQIKSFEIPIPSIKEQSKISEALAHWDLLIEKTTQLIKAKEKRKKALMQNLLTGKVRFKEFKKAKWELTSIGKVAKIKHGKDQKKIVDDNGKYPILGTGGELGRTNNFLCNKPSVLIGRKGTIDRPVFIDTPFWTVDTLFYTEIDKNVIPKWLFYMFQSINWREYNEASGVPSLSASTISSIPIELPTFREQIRISNILTETDNEIRLLKSQFKKLELQKKGLMQKLLTGKIRVKTK